MYKSLIVSLTFLFISDVVLGVPDYKFNNDVNGWLKLHKVPATWQDAFVTCHAEGAVLASPLTKQLENALLEIMLKVTNNSPIFLGANSLWSETELISIEGVPLDDMSINLAYGDGSKPEHCLVMWPDKAFIYSCNKYLPYICYKKNEKALQLNECGTFDDNYQFNETTGSCYKLHEKETRWDQAYKTCVAEGAYLVVINDKQEADVVMALFPKKTPEDKSEGVALSHIGLRDWNKDFTWVTVTGDNIEDVYHKWALNKPDQKGAHLCASLLADGTLDNHWCNLRLKYVCEKNPKTSRFERVADEKQ